LPRTVWYVVKCANVDDMGLHGYNETLDGEDVAFTPEKGTNIEWEPGHPTTRYGGRLILVRRDITLSPFVIQGRNTHMKQKMSLRRRNAYQVVWRKLLGEPSHSPFLRIYV